MTKPTSTITDVAKAADVAVGTVSRVLNNHPEVNEDIRDRVLRTARKLNYQRRRQRKSPREPVNGVAAGNIAVICFGMEDTLVQLAVVSTALQGIERALSAKGRSLMFANVPSGDRIPPFLREKHVEGLILKGPNQGELPSDSELVREIYRLPRVWLMGRLNHARGDHCNFDTEIAGRLVAEHFHARHHRQVAFFNPKPGQTQFEKVKASFEFSAHKLGLSYSLLESPPPERLTWPLPATTHEDNVQRLSDQWAALPPRTRPTALFVPSDRTAVQLYSVLQRRGLQVGRDVSVVSCNNEKSLVNGLHPAVSSVDVHAELIGRRAVEQLLWRIAHPSESIDTQVLIEPTLVERASVISL
jgi:LacI family transcriptional regulator